VFTDLSIKNTTLDGDIKHGTTNFKFLWHLRNMLVFAVFTDLSIKNTTLDGDIKHGTTNFQFLWHLRNMLVVATLIKKYSWKVVRALLPSVYVGKRNIWIHSPLIVLFEVMFYLSENGHLFADRTLYSNIMVGKISRKLR
jgi:hypothetical protein